MVGTEDDLETKVYHFRLPLTYKNSIEDILDETSYTTMSDVVRDAGALFYDLELLGNIPIIMDADCGARMSVKYNPGVNEADRKLDLLMEDARSSEYATAKDALVTALGWYIGEIDFDWQEIENVIGNAREMEREESIKAFEA